jgi:WD40 repeat protein
LALSPSGKYLATAWPGGVDLWDLKSGKRTWRLPGHCKDRIAPFMDQGNGIAALAWSPGDRWLASLAANDTIKVWDTVTGKEALSFDLDNVGFQQPVVPESDVELSWSADGGRLAAVTGHDQLVRVWEIPTGKIVNAFLLFPRGGLPATLSPDGTQLASALSAGGLALWDVATGREIKSIPLNRPTVGGGGELSWSPDGRRVLFGTSIWDLETGSLLSVDAPHSVTQSAWDIEGKRILVFHRDPGTVKAFDAATGKETKDYARSFDSTAKARHIAWNKDGPQMAVAHEIHWTPNGPRLVVQAGSNEVEVSADDGFVELVDLDTGRSRFTAKPPLGESVAPPDPVWAIAWKPDGSELATVHRDGFIRTWDAVTGRQLRRLPIGATPFSLPPHPVVTGALEWAPDGKSLAYGGEVWDLTADAKGRTWRVGSDALNAICLLSLAWSPDGRRLATLGNRGRKAVAQVWEASTGKELFSWDIDGLAGAGAAGLVVWSPDGKRVAAGVQSVHVWDADKGQEVFELTGPTAPLARVEWSDDGRRIIARTPPRDKADAPPQELVVWDADTGAQVLTVYGPSAGVLAAPGWQWSAMYIQRITPGKD